MKKLCFVAGSVLVLFLLTMPLYGQMKGAPVPFSADWANYEEDQRQESGKYFASTEGIRLEGTAGGEPFSIIYNFNLMVAWNLIETASMYIETAIDSDELGMDDLGQFGAPCPTDAHATSSGSETLNGRKTEKWVCVSPQQETMTVWYDIGLQTVIRSEDEDGRFELTNIKEGHQPDSLFVPPPGYSKMDISGFGIPTGLPQGE